MMQGRAGAQTAGPTPIKPDIFWYPSSSTGASYIAGLNTAMIDIDSNGINFTKTTLLVSNYYGNGTPGGVIFRDESSGFSFTQTYTTGPVPNFYIDGSPDITIGNNIANPGNVYNVAVAYICRDIVTTVRAPQIDYYKVTYTGPGVFSVLYTGSTTFINVSEPSTIHIDVIAQAANTGPTGFAFADHFIVTWDDLAYPGGRVFGFQSSVNAPIAVINEITAPVMASSGMNPDVAGVERDPLASGPTDFGLFTYTGGTGTMLSYCEWDVAAAPTPSLTYPLDFAPVGAEFMFPRIDAKDDYTTNAPTPFYPAFYKVAVQRNLGFTKDVRTYDHIACVGGLGFWGFNSFMPLGTNQYTPTVAFGPNLTDFAVAYNSDDPTSWPSHPTWNTLSAPIADGNSYACSGGNYNLVNFNPFAASWFVNGNYLVATSTPCNNPSSHTLVAWSYNIPALLPFPRSEVYFKTTKYPYVFKPGRDTHELSATLPTKWRTYPDPATTTLNVDNPLKGDARYEVTDVQGRKTLAGSIAAGAQALDLRSLVPGVYNIRMYDYGKQCYTSKFVKQ
jgi:hypothetical protein